MDPSTIREQIQDQLGTPYNVDLDRINDGAYFIQNVAAILLGAIAYCIAILMTLITAIDICYLTIPMFRERVHALRWDGSKSKYLRAVSRDAVAAVEEADTVNTGQSVIGIYLKKRLKTYIVSVTILVVILGGMGYLKAIIVRIVLTILKAVHG